MASNIAKKAFASAKAAKVKTDKITVTNNINLDDTTESIASLTQYTTVAAVTNTYTLDVNNQAVKNFRITTADANAKTVAFSNVPAETEILIELTYTNAAAITWPAGITWLSGSAPSLTAGKKYRILFFTVNGGTAWQAASVGGW